MEYKVFYSWQSDSPNSTNRTLILDALEAAAQTMARDDKIEVEPVIDRDTVGEAGSPEISSTIFKKIEAAQVFVADVSLINPNSTDRAVSNPNVLLELGYAARHLGWERVVMVLNLESGKIESLPFDLRMRRVVSYRSATGDSDRATPRRQLAKDLERALRAIIDKTGQPVGEAIAPPTLADQAIEAIEQQKANQAASVRKFIESAVDQLKQSAPTWEPGEEWDEQLVKALDASEPIVVQYAKVAETIAEMDALEPAKAMFRGFEKVLSLYELPRGFTGSYSETQFDFYKFLGHEFLITFIAALMRHERWKIITEVLDQNLYPDNLRTDHGKPERDYRVISEYVSLLATRNKRLSLGRLSLHADLLSARHEREPLLSVAPMDSIIAADLLLYIRSAVQKDETERWVRWRPWSALYAKRLPRFLIEAERKSNAARILPALGSDDVEFIQLTIKNWLPELQKLFGFEWDYPFDFYNPDKIASR